jgi:predicted RecA/RadA family phage recombinase
MNAQFLHDGNTIDFTPTTAIAAGDIVTRGGLVGIAKLDIDAGSQGALSLSGVYKIAKGTEKFVTGESVFWNATTSQATHTLTDNQYLGKAVAYTGETDETVSVRLEQPAGALFANAVLTPSSPETGETEGSGGSGSGTGESGGETGGGTGGSTDTGEPILVLPLTDNTGGTATTTINSVLFDTLDRQTANSYASFAAKINEIIAALESKGIVKTSE